jgi:hypothetical protein
MADHTNETLRLLYEGDITEHFNQFKARFVETDADMTSRNFDIENHIKTIVDSRLLVTPVTFDINAGDHQDTIDGWIEKPVFGAGQNFWENQMRWNLDLELYGTNYHQFFEGDDDLHVNLIPPDVEATIKTSEFNVDEILSYEFYWKPFSEIKKDGTSEDKVYGHGQRTLIYSEDGVEEVGFERGILGKKKETRNQLSAANGLWQIHRMRRFPRSDSPYGPSAVEELIEDQNGVNFIAHCLFLAIKMLAFGMYGPPASLNEEQMGLWLGAYNADKTHRVYPGKLNTYALEVIKGDPQLEGLLKRLQAKVENMYHKAQVPIRRENVDLRSRKAELFSSHELAEYTEQVTRTRARQWEQFFGKYLALKGEVEKPEDAEIKITYPAFETKGAEEQKITLEALTTAKADGIISKETYLKELVRVGIFDKDLDIEEELVKSEDEAVKDGAMFEEAKVEARGEIQAEEQMVKKAVSGGENPFEKKPEEEKE